MKHSIERLRPVFAGSRYRGALLHTVRGWDAHDSTGARTGSYPEDQADAAVKKLRFMRDGSAGSLSHF